MWPYMEKGSGIPDKWWPAFPGFSGKRENSRRQQCLGLVAGRDAFSRREASPNSPKMTVSSVSSA